jgi:hypothetical protein
LSFKLQWIIIMDSNSCFMLLLRKQYRNIPSQAVLNNFLQRQFHSFIASNANAIIIPKCYNISDMYVQSTI